MLYHSPLYCDRVRPSVTHSEGSFLTHRYAVAVFVRLIFLRHLNDGDAKICPNPERNDKTDRWQDGDTVSLRKPAPISAKKERREWQVSVGDAVSLRQRAPISAAKETVVLSFKYDGFIQPIFSEMNVATKESMHCIFVSLETGVKGGVHEDINYLSWW